MGYEVDELGKFGDDGDFDDGYEQNIEYVIDSEDYRIFWYKNRLLKLYSARFFFSLISENQSVLDPASVFVKYSMYKTLLL